LACGSKQTPDRVSNKTTEMTRQDILFSRMKAGNFVPEKSGFDRHGLGGGLADGGGELVHPQLIQLALVLLDLPPALLLVRVCLIHFPHLTFPLLLWLFFGLLEEENEMGISSRTINK
jgi:hypothetical protein